MRALASAILARIAAREDVLTTLSTRKFSEFPGQVGQHAGDFPKGGPHMFLGDAGKVARLGVARWPSHLRTPATNANKAGHRLNHALPKHPDLPAKQ